MVVLHCVSLGFSAALFTEPSGILFGKTVIPGKVTILPVKQMFSLQLYIYVVLTGWLDNCNQVPFTLVSSKLLG